MSNLGPTIRRFLLGERLPTSRGLHERLPKLLALPTFGADAISSTAYATEEILLVLMVAGSAGLALCVPVAVAIGVLFTIVALSYRQTVVAYPGGGGAYTVARENLGELAGLTAAAALLTDYVLTVAVSIASGVAAIISAVPDAAAWRVPLCLFFIVLITLINLRGAKESGKVFAGPTYLFVFSVLLMLVVGMIREALSGGTPPPSPTAFPVSAQLSVFLLLRAFASGCAALTGIESIANSVPAFRPPESKNAAATTLWMLAICVILNLGLAGLAHIHHVVPDESQSQTVLSMLGHYVFGNGALYYVLQIATAILLTLAATSSFAGFPRLTSILARDGFAPRQLANLGDRLVFSNGILLLGISAALLTVIFRGMTHSLIPLYAVGVFISFTLSQAGMVVRWHKLRTPRWRSNAAVNAAGALTTGVVLCVVAAVKFLLGAWIVVVVVPLIILLFLMIHRHYRTLADVLRVDDEAMSPTAHPWRQAVLIHVCELDPAAIPALAYARTLDAECHAVYFNRDAAALADFQAQWERAAMGITLTVVSATPAEAVADMRERVRQVLATRQVDAVTVIMTRPRPGALGDRRRGDRHAAAIWAGLQHEPQTVMLEMGAPAGEVAASAAEMQPVPRAVRNAVIVLVPGLHRGILGALSYAKALNDAAEAVFVETDPASTAPLQESWYRYRTGLPLTVLKSAWRSLAEPIIRYVHTVRAEKGIDVVTIIIPEFAVERWWNRLLHNQDAAMIQSALSGEPGVVIGSIPYRANHANHAASGEDGDHSV